MGLSSTLALPEITRERGWAKEAIIVLMASVLIGMFAPVSIHLPFTPVPIVVQSHIILFFAALLGSKRGTLAVIAFLTQAAMGLPVLAGGKGGLLVFAGPTGGYLIGYIVGAFITGLIAENLKKRTLSKTFGALLAGNCAIFLFGFAHLASFIGLEKAALLGVVPFLLGDFLKTLVCLRGLKAVRFYEDRLK